MSEPWYEQPMRWVQLNLVEDDALRADVDAWAEYWRRARVDGVTISAAGAAAYYPTEVPHHRRAEFLGDRDLFGELCHAAVSAGVRVLARFEPNFAHDEMRQAHPDWFQTGPDGRPRTMADLAASHAESPQLAALLASSMPPDLYVPCANGPYYREFVPEVMTELATRYPIDGFFANGWPHTGSSPPGPSSTCHCPHCLRAWSARGKGHDRYPEHADPDDPLWADFVLFVQESVFDVQAAWQAHAKSIRPDLTFAACVSGSPASGLRWGELLPTVDLVANDSQGRLAGGPSGTGPGRSALWAAGRSAQLLRGATPGRTVFHIVGAWQTGAPPLRRAAKETPELTLSLAQAVAKGARPWSNVAGAVVHDRRWLDGLADYYRWHAASERYLRDRRSLADVALVWTPSSAWAAWWGKGGMPRGPSLVDALNGWHLASLRSRVPYDAVPDWRLADEDLSRYEVLIVPSGSSLDPRAAEAIAAHAEAGRGVVMGCGALTAGLRKADGHLGLATALGVRLPDAPEGPRLQCYLHIEASELDHPLLAGLGDTDFLAAGMWVAPAAPAEDATGVTRFVPPLPFFADKAFLSAPIDPATVLSASGRCVYLGSDLDAAFGQHHLADSGRILANAVRLAAGGRRPVVEVDGPGLVDVHAWEQDGASTVHLVNFTTPDLYGGPVVQLVDAGAQRVRLRPPEGSSVGAVRLLRRDEPVAWSTSVDGSVELEVPSLVDFEVVAADLIR